MLLERIYPSMWKNYLVTPTIKNIKPFQTLDHLRLFRLHYKRKRNLWMNKLENADAKYEHHADETGFRRRFFCAISLIIEDYDSGKFIRLLLMDFHKGFHSIDSKILLSILKEKVFHKTPIANMKSTF